MRTQVTWLRTPGPQPTLGAGPNETKWDPQGEEGKKVWVMVSTLRRDPSGSRKQGLCPCF